LALAEDRQYGWLMKRMDELGVQPKERKVSTMLWESFMKCQSAKEFALYMANAEERGRIAGERFRLGMKSVDPVTAEIFGKIAEEEVEHIRLAHRYYPSEDNDHEETK
jgi:hypothetical protein